MYFIPVNMSTRRRRKNNNSMSRFTDFMSDFEVFQEYMSKKDKEKKEKDKHKVAPKFSFLEMWGLCMTLGPVITLMYIFGIKWMAIQISQLVQ